MKSRFIQTFVMLFVLCSSAACVADDPIEIVRQGVLKAFPTTTIGQAFDNYEGFSKTTWETETMPNGTRIVVFTAELPREYWDPSVASDIPTAIDKATLYIQFTLNADDTFSIGPYTAIYSGADFTAVEAFCRRKGPLATMTEDGCGKICTSFSLSCIYSNTPLFFF